MNASTSPEQFSPTVPSPPFVLINTFYAKAGKLDEFIELQIAEARRLRETARQMGWLGNRIHRSVDETSAVIVTAFRSREAQQEWSRSGAFSDHLVRIMPLLERVESHPCELVFRSGD
jgi:heme-degrading monooxygenase HmoA